MNFEHDNLSGGQENLTRLAADIKSWGRALGFDEVGITDTGLSAAEVGLAAWLEAGCHGQMDYMYKHGLKRSRPEALVPGTRRVISARMSYLPDAEDALAVLNDPARAYVSRYALGRDYHKVLRARLQKLADRIAEAAQQLGLAAAAVVVNVQGDAGGGIQKFAVVADDDHRAFVLFEPGFQPDQRVQVQVVGGFVE